MVTYERAGRVARIRMDDGKVNAMSVAMLSGLHAAFDRAAADEAIPVLSGRAGLFSAGFDLKVFSHGNAKDIHAMPNLGGELALKLLSFPMPVIAAASGHAYPMGAFLILSSDWRVGTEGDWRIGLNEVQIGMTVPSFALEIARQRLTPAHFSRTAMTGEMFAPQVALAAGFLDEVVASDGLEGAIARAAERLGRIDFAAHAATKLRARKPTIDAVRAAIDAEFTLESVEKSVARRVA